MTGQVRTCARDGCGNQVIRKQGGGPPPCCPACRADARAGYQARVLDEAFAAYGGGCFCCGTSRRTFLQLVYVKNDGVEQRRRTGLTGGFPLASWLKAHGWPAGYEVLCANCRLERIRLGRCACSGWAGPDGSPGTRAGRKQR